MRARLLLVLLVLSAWTAVVAVRLYQLQIRDHDKYRRDAGGQQYDEVTLAPPRGTIFDARGQELAVSLEVDSAHANPRALAESHAPGAIAERIAKVLPGIDRKRLAQDLAKDRDFVWVARQLDPVDSRRLRALGLPEIGFQPESKRYYPQHELAAQVLGFVGRDHNGLGGLEYRYEELIAGRAAKRRVVRDALGRTALYPDLAFGEVEPGADLYLTIDASVQHIAERELARAVEATGSHHGSVVVLDPASGAILAMATAPGFDPNRFQSYRHELYRNRAVADAFEPGSTFKMVTTAAALEAGVARPDDLFDCGMGQIVLADVRIKDHKPFGLLTLREVIAKSSNIGAIRVGLRAGAARFYETIRAFGFGAAESRDFLGESPGQLLPLARWRPTLTTAYASFGQGLSATALQMANAFAVVANGGTLYRPYVVAAVARRGRIERVQPEVLGRPISRATAAALTQMLEGVVTDGTAKSAAIPGYRVAGKTGTGQKAIPGQGYSPTRVTASFIGFAPVDRPAVVCLVALDEPHGAIHGGEVAAPVFRAIVSQVLPYLGVPPDPLPEERRRPTPPPPDQRLAQLAAEQSGAPAAALAAEPPPPGSLPDLAGLSARQAIARLAELGLGAELHGQGFVVRQQPAPGVPLAGVGGLELWLGRRLLE